MAFEATEKEKALESLMATRRQGQLAELSLRLQDKTDGAEKVWESTARLSTEIDIMLGKIMEEWLGRADQIIKGLNAANAKLETAVSGIKGNIKTAQNVVKVVGLLDDAVAIAKKAFLAM
jgi:ABC-type transporter Mla subunit MlaD